MKVQKRHVQGVSEHGRHKVHKSAHMEPTRLNPYPVSVIIIMRPSMATDLVLVLRPGQASDLVLVRPSLASDLVLVLWPSPACHQTLCFPRVSAISEVLDGAKRLQDKG